MPSKSATKLIRRPKTATAKKPKMKAKGKKAYQAPPVSGSGGGSAPTIVIAPVFGGIPPGPSHGVSGFSTTGMPSGFGSYTPSGVMLTPMNPSASAYNTQLHVPVGSTNTFAAPQTPMAPQNLFPGGGNQTTPATLPGIAGTGPSSTSIAPPKPPGSIAHNNLGGHFPDSTPSESGPYNVTPASTNTIVHPLTPMPSPRSGGFPGTQGTTNLWGSGGWPPAPSSNNDHAGMAAPTTPAVGNDTNAHAGTNPAFGSAVGSSPWMFYSPPPLLSSLPPAAPPLSTSTGATGVPHSTSYSMPSSPYLNRWGVMPRSLSFS